VLNIDQNLLSVAELVEKGFEVIFEYNWVFDQRSTQGKRCVQGEDEI